MVTVAEIGTIFTSAKTAYEIAKGINSLNTEVERNESVAKVLEILLAVQSDALEMKEKHHLLLEEIDRLKKEIMQFEKWSETEKQYELKEVAPGVLAYVYKQTNDSTQPVHWLCANCYKDRTPSILQLVSESMGGKKYSCPHCKNDIHIRYDSPNSSYPRSGGGGPNSWMGA